MQGTYIPRKLSGQILAYIDHFPAIAILGPRQAGKSTLAGWIAGQYEQAIYLDLEQPSDLQKLNEPELFFDANADRLVCLDAIQRAPDLFTILRGVIDKRGRNGQFLILGSASRDLIRQSSETLAGRIIYLELQPFDYTEISETGSSLNTYWLRGGFPRSFLSQDDHLSMVWRKNFIRTYLERDIPQLGFQLSSEILHRFWQMCAHNQGHVLNLSMLGDALGVTHPTIRSYIDILSQTFMLRLLKPYHTNLKKRLIKSPKIYIRDSGILHALLNLESVNELLGHPVCGRSWEGMAIENVFSHFSDWDICYYRTHAGAEIDLIASKGQTKIGFELKASMAPKITSGFWKTIEELQLSHTYIVAPVAESYPLKKHVTVIPLREIETVTQARSS